ncbi:MAG: tetratricopeptide repeat protein [Gemmatimonadota bacterium]
MPAFAEALRLGQSELRVLPFLASAYAGADRRTEALQALRRIEQQFPERFDLEFGLARVYVALGQYEQALQALEKDMRVSRAGLHR